VLPGGVGAGVSSTLVFLAIGSAADSAPFMPARSRGCVYECGEKGRE
jgi:hypothetical protein